MSREHRASLVVFVIVAIICFAFLITAARSEALRGFVQVAVTSAAGPGRPVPVTSGVTADLSEAWAGAVGVAQDAEPAGVVEEVTARLVRAGHFVSRHRFERSGLRDTRHDDRRGHEQTSHGREHRNAGRTPDRGDHAHGEGKHPGKGKGHDKGHGKGKHPGKSKGQDKAEHPGKDKAKDHGRSKGHDKAHGKGNHSGRGHRS